MKYPLVRGRSVIQTDLMNMSIENRLNETPTHTPKPERLSLGAVLLWFEDTSMVRICVKVKPQ